MYESLFFYDLCFYNYLTVKFRRLIITRLKNVETQFCMKIILPISLQLVTMINQQITYKMITALIIIIFVIEIKHLCTNIHRYAYENLCRNLKKCILSFDCIPTC